jgi:putative zinc finger/helix-turn-helix YgiT family protein
MKCEICGETFYTVEQADQRQERAIERARQDDNLLTPRQIKSVREDLGLTQRQFEDLLGVGEKTCVRWENGRVCQNTATDRLIRLLVANRSNLRVLAAINAVALPNSCAPPPRVSRSGTHETPWDLLTAAHQLRPKKLFQLSGSVESDDTIDDEYGTLAASMQKLPTRQVTDTNSQVFAAMFGTTPLGGRTRERS